MNTTNQKNSNIGNRGSKNLNQIANDKNTLMNEEMYDLDKMKQTDNSQNEIANRGYTIRNGYDPNKPNQDQDQITNDEDDLDDIDPDDEEEEKDKYIEDDIQKEEEEDDYPANDPRKF